MHGQITAVMSNAFQLKVFTVLSLQKVLESQFFKTDVYPTKTAGSIVSLADSPNGSQTTSVYIYVYIHRYWTY